MISADPRLPRANPSAPPPEPPAAPGMILGRYRLQERLALGGSATIWRALDVRSGRRVAVKLLHPHLLPDHASRLRLIGEARAVAGLRHDGIVRVLDVDPGEQPAVVFELIPGEALSTRLSRQGPMHAPDAARIGAGLADALYHAHIHGVIHRDVKPGNVLLGRDGAPHLVDFGIARILGEAAERSTQTGMVMGTLRYMAPEQLAGDPVTPRVDLYGLGATLYEMLTGTPPYPAQSPAGLLHAQDDGPPQLDGIEPALAGLVRACLAGRPQDRPLHAGVVADALRAWLAGDFGPARALATAVPQPEAPVVDPAAVTAPVARKPAPAPRRDRPRAPRFALAAAALLALLVLLGGVAAVTRLATAPAGVAVPPRATPSATAPLPPWAATLAAAYRSGCATDGPTASELAAMGEATASRYVDALVAACQAQAASAQTGGGGNGGGKGKGHGHD